MKTHGSMIFLLISIIILVNISEGLKQSSSDLTALEVRDVAIKERNKRQAEGEGGEGGGDDGGGGGWTGLVKSVIDQAGQFKDLVGNLGSAATGVFKIISQFRQLSADRAKLRLQERQFQMQIEQKTTELCLKICVTGWSPWTPCTRNCGGGTMSRSRSPFGGSMCSGKPCPYHFNETMTCNTGCANNGMPVNGQCQCTRGFTGACCNNEITCQYPGNPTHGDASPREPAKFGGVISYSCSVGFALVGQEVRICGADSRWEGTAPKCEKVTCSEPQTPEDGQNLNKQGIYSVGGEVYFRCNYGYDLSGPTKRTCTNVNGGTDGIWTGFTPLCLPVNCGNPGYPLNGYSNGTEYTLGNVAYFSCKTGFRLVGSERRECLASGQWSGHQATCEMITCEEPPIPRNGYLRRTRETYYMSLTVTFMCQDGYTLEGSSSAICERDPELSHLGGGGKWSKEPPICKPTNCGDPGTIENGAKDGSLLYYPNNVTFVCFGGYILQGASEIHCGYNGVWSAPPPTCTACQKNEYNSNTDGTNQCTPCPENTHTATDASTSAQQCICDVGFTGSPGGPCFEIVCPVLTTPANGEMTCEGNKYQNKCDFSCNAGYILDKGSSRRTCQDNGAWTGTDSQCSACPLNTYKSDERSCLPCPVHSHTTSIASVKDQCVCNAGYEGPAGGPCSDANECSANGGKGSCEDVCRNTDGSYVCECSIPGYIIDTDVDKHACKVDKTCRNLTEADAPGNGGLVCHWYREENSQQCAVRCNNGYEFPSRTNNYETCGLTTGYKWSHEERGETIKDCIEEFFPGIRLEGNSSYFVQNCRDLTPDEQQKVKDDFAKLLTDEGICINRQTKVCDAENVGIICGATRRRRKRGVTQTVDEVNVSFELAAKMYQPSDCDQICNMLNIREKCEELCMPRYRRFLMALMKYTKRAVENLFNDPRKVNFQSGNHPFMYQRGSLKTSDVIVKCPTGMKKDEMCVPCDSGTYYSETNNDCVKCPTHTYQANPQQTVCNQCPNGTYAPNTGSYKCLICPYNTWGDRCSKQCNCERGQCDPATGRCICYSGWEGPTCNIDIQSCTAESCYPGVKCHDIPAPGTGLRCDACPAGFQGDGTICEPNSRRRKREIMERVVSDTDNILQLASLKALNLGSYNFP